MKERFESCMNNIDIMNYWIESSDKDYEVMLDLQ